MSVKGLILDFGEVLTRSQPRAVLDRMATLAGLPFDELVSRYWMHRAAYDGGLTARNTGAGFSMDLCGPSSSPI